MVPADVLLPECWPNTKVKAHLGGVAHVTYRWNGLELLHRLPLLYSNCWKSRYNRGWFTETATEFSNRILQSLRNPTTFYSNKPQPVVMDTERRNRKRRKALKNIRNGQLTIEITYFSHCCSTKAIVLILQNLLNLQPYCTHIRTVNILQLDILPG